MSEQTTNYECPQGCGAVLTTQTAVAHGCGTGVGGDAENMAQATDTGAGEQPEASESTPAGGALLSADYVGMMQGMADYWSGQPLPPSVQAFLATDVPSLLASHAALTARLAAALAERDAALASLMELLARAQEALDYATVPPASPVQFWRPGYISADHIAALGAAIVRAANGMRLEPPDGR